MPRLAWLPAPPCVHQSRLERRRRDTDAAEGSLSLVTFPTGEPHKEVPRVKLQPVIQSHALVSRSNNRLPGRYAEPLEHGEQSCIGEIEPDVGLGHRTTGTTPVAVTRTRSAACAHAPMAAKAGSYGPGVGCDGLGRWGSDGAPARTAIGCRGDDGVVVLGTGAGCPPMGLVDEEHGRNVVGGAVQCGDPLPCPWPVEVGDGEDQYIKRPSAVDRVMAPRKKSPAPAKRRQIRPETHLKGGWFDGPRQQGEALSVSWNSGRRRRRR